MTDIPDWVPAQYHEVVCEIAAKGWDLQPEGTPIEADDRCWWAYPGQVERDTLREDMGWKPNRHDIDTWYSGFKHRIGDAPLLVFRRSTTDVPEWVPAEFHGVVRQSAELGWPLCPKGTQATLDDRAWTAHKGSSSRMLNETDPGWRIDCGYRHRTCGDKEDFAPLLLFRRSATDVPEWVPAECVAGVQARADVGWHLIPKGDSPKPGDRYYWVSANSPFNKDTQLWEVSALDQSYNCGARNITCTLLIFRNANSTPARTLLSVTVVEHLANGRCTIEVAGCDRMVVDSSLLVDKPTAEEVFTQLRDIIKEALE